MEIRQKIEKTKRTVKNKWIKFKLNHPDAARFVKNVPYIVAGAFLGALGTAAANKLTSESTGNCSDAYDDGFGDGVDYAVKGVIQSTNYTNKELADAFKENGIRIKNRNLESK